MVFPEMILPVCNQGFLIVSEAVVLLPLLVDDILCLLLLDGLSISLHFALRRFSRVSVFYVLLQY